MVSRFCQSIGFGTTEDFVDPYQCSVPPLIHWHRIRKRVSEKSIEDRRVVEDGLEVCKSLHDRDVEGVFRITTHPAKVVKLEKKNESKLLTKILIYKLYAYFTK